MILGVVIAALGGGPVVDAVRATDGGSLAAGAGVAVLTTVCAAWRWRLVAGRLHAELTMPSAVAACYRSQFVNVTLPGGVLGDIGRGVHHGRAVDDVARGLRTVVWERACGQAVLAVTTIAVLVVARPFAVPALAVPAWVPLAAVVLCVGGALAARRARPGVAERAARVAVADLRVLSGPATWVGVALASLAVVAGHVATFVVAARAVGVGLEVAEIVPLALLVLLVSAVPLNLAGWGPREGAAAWAFAAAGLSASQGLTVAVAYGAIVLVAALPGAVLLVWRRSTRTRSRMPWGAARWARPGAPAASAVPGGGARG